MTNLLSKFPDSFTPNKQQIKLIRNIEQAFEDGYKFVVCSAPTGSGKSFISKTLGNNSRPPTKDFLDLVNTYQVFKRSQTGDYQYSDEIQEQKPFGAFALTITKALQDQYKDLFSEVDVLKGKSNYQCSYDENYNVEYAPCVLSKKIKDECWNKNSCPYYEARNRAITSCFSTLNYNMFFALPYHVKRKQYIICDEASELEDQLVKEFSCQINFEILRKLEVAIRPLPSDDDYGKLGRWLSTLSMDIEDRVEELKEVTGKNDSKNTALYVSEKKSELISLLNLQSKIKTLIDTWHDSEYIVERVAKGVNFMPLKVDKLSKHIFDYADKVILMSATIIDPSNFCKTLGIDKFKYIEAESTFDSSKAPIYANTKIKLNYNNLQSNLPKIIKQIREICNIHSNEKGIIHTQTNTITNYLKDTLSDNRVLYREPGVKNEDILEMHQNSNSPTILASPSMSYGVDLKDDLARFQIIIKAPYLPMIDKRVEKMMKLDFSWYMNKMLCSLIQACGRGVRSHKDHCVTYILDAAITEAIIKNKSKIPKYFLDRFV
jgi:ATP-dependent DNA helicase DinG